MSMNPYTYYEEKPLEKTAPRLNVSDDGEPEPDCEPRFPLEFSAKYVMHLRLAVKSYPFVVTQHSMSFRSPDGKQMEIPREEASKRVHFGPSKLRIDMEPNVFWEFVYDRRKKDFELVLARLKIWGLQITDPEEAYRTVQRNLYQQVIGAQLIIFLVLFLFYSLFIMALMSTRDVSEETLPAQILITSAKLFRWGTVAACLGGLPFLIAKSTYSKNVLHMLLLTMMPQAMILFFIFFTNVEGLRPFFSPLQYLDFYVPIFSLQIYLRLRRLERRLQRENEKLSWE